MRSVYLDEFGLNSRWMNALVMKEGLDFLRYPHVVPKVLTRDVCWGNDAIPRQLPNVELVYGDNALNLSMIV